MEYVAVITLDGLCRSCLKIATAILLVFEICLYSAISLAAQSDESEFARFDFRPEEPICARVKVFNNEFLFVIDTGASSTTFDTSFRDRLGPPIEQAAAITFAANAMVSLHQCPPMKLIGRENEITVTVPFVTSGDLSAFRSAAGIDIAGFIGMDFLKDYCLRLNVDGEYAALVSGPRALPAEITKIDFGKSPKAITPALRMRVSDQGFFPVFVDTGSINGVLTLDPVTFKTFLARGRIIEEGGAIGAGLSGFTGHSSGFIDEIELGNLKLRNLWAQSTRLNTIGLGFLERFEAEFDFPNRKAYFRKGKRFDSPERMNLSNFGVKNSEGKLVVIGVRGIAESAGIHVDDVITHVNGRPATEIPLPQFRLLQCVPDTDLKLTFKREGKSFDAVLALKRKPDPFPAAPPVLDFDKSDK